MSTLTMAEVICMALFCCLLGPTLGLSNLQGLNSERTRRGLLGTGGGLLGGVLGGGGKDSGGGLLGGVLGGGGKDSGGGLLGGVLGGGGNDSGGGLLGGVLGGGGNDSGGGLLGGVLGGGGKDSGGGLLGGVLGGGGKGVLGGVLGGDGGKGGGLVGDVLGDGLLGGVGGLLNSTVNGVLPGVGDLLNGTLDQKKLLNILTGQNGLLGLTDLLDLLGLGKGPQKSFQWENILNIQFIRGSWKIVRGTELILNLQSKIIINLPVPLFRNVTVDVDTTADLAITQDKPGDLKLVLKNCEKLVAGFTIKLPSGLLTLLIQNVVNSAIQNTLPAVLCPILQEWINYINVNLQTLNNQAFFGLLGSIHRTLSTIPITSGHVFELDLKDKPFPGFFLKQLFGGEKVNPETD